MNTDPDKATNAYEGMGPSLEHLEQIHGATSLDNIPAGRNCPQPTRSLSSRKEAKLVRKKQERSKDMEVDRKEYEIWTEELILEVISEIESSRLFCTGLMGELQN